MIGQDRGINVPGLLLVKGPHPRFVVVGADDDSQGRTVDVSWYVPLEKDYLFGKYLPKKCNLVKISGCC